MTWARKGAQAVPENLILRGRTITNSLSPCPLSI